MYARTRVKMTLRICFTAVNCYVARGGDERGRGRERENVANGQRSTCSVQTGADEMG